MPTKKHIQNNEEACPNCVEKRETALNTIITQHKKQPYLTAILSPKTSTQTNYPKG